MNPLSAFSFGKVIKTFIPGLIATAALLLVVEMLYRTSVTTSCPAAGGFWGCFFRESFFRRIILAEGARTTAFGAVVGDATAAPSVRLGDFFLPLMNLERLTFLSDS